jgi:hypothetical protein
MSKVAGRPLLKYYGKLPVNSESVLVYRKLTGNIGPLLMSYFYRHSFLLIRLAIFEIKDSSVIVKT